MDFAIPFTLTPTLDVPKLNAMLSALKQSLGKFGSEIKLIDRAQLQGDLDKLNSAAKQASATISQVGASGKGLQGAFQFNQVTQAVTQLASTFQSLSEPFVKFDAGLKELSAITGVSGAGLDDLGNRARAMALEFGGSVITQIDAFKGVLSRIGPQLAEAPEALERVSRAINTLSAASGDDAAQSMDALTTVMLQFGVDTSNATEVAAQAERAMNVLAKSAQVGAAEIPQVADAIKVTGVAAFGANQSIEETTAAIQVLAAGGKFGSEAGTGLRNIFGFLQKQSGEGEKQLAKMGLSVEQLGQTLNTQGLSAALEQLNGGMQKLAPGAERNAALMQLFGSENAATAGILLRNTATIKQWTKDVTGSNSAIEQANVRMTSLESIQARVSAAIEGGLISVFQTIGPSITAGLNGIAQVAPTVSTLVGLKSIFPPELAQNALAFGKSILQGGQAILSALVPGLFAQTTATGAATGAQTGLNAAMAANPIGVVVAGIVLLVAAFYALYKTVEPFRNAVDGALTFVVQAFEQAEPVLSKVGDVFVLLGGLWLDYILAPFQIGIDIISAVVGALFSLGGAGTSSEGALQTLGTVLAWLGERLNDVKAFIAGFKAGIASVVQSIGGIIGKISSGDILGALSDLSDIGDTAGQSFKDAFTQSLQGSQVQDASEKMGKILADSITNEASKVDVSGLANSLADAQKQITELSARKSKGEKLTAEEEASLLSLQNIAQQTANKIAQVMPEAATGFKTVVNAQGELVKVYDINLAKAQLLAAAQGAAGSTGSVAQQQYSAELVKTAGIYEQQKGKLEEVRKAAEDAAKAGDADTAKKKIEEYNELKKQVDETGAAMTKAFVDGSNAGLLTEDAIKRVAKAQGISEQQAKQQLLAAALKEAASKGAVTESTIESIAKKFGVSKVEAQKMLDEQKRQTKEAEQTAAAVKDIGQAFDESLKKANAAVSAGISRLAGIKNELQGLGSRTDLTPEQKAAEKRRLEEQYQAEYKETKETDRQRDNQQAILDIEKAKFETQKKSSSSGGSKKEKESEYQIAKKGFEIQKDALENKAKLNSLERERIRLSSGQEEAALTDNLLDNIEQMKTLVQQARTFATAIKVEGIDTTSSLDEIVGDPKKLDQFLADYQKVVTAIEDPKSTTEIQVGMKLGKPEDRNDAIKTLRAFVESLKESQNATIALGLEANIDADKIREALEKQLRADVKVGVKGKESLEEFLRSDVVRITEESEQVKSRLVAEATALRASGVIDTEEKLAARIKAIQAGGTEEQIALAEKIAARKQELLEIEGAREKEALDKKIAAEEEAAEKIIATNRQLVDAISRVSEAVGRGAIEAEKNERLKKLEEQKKEKLISDRNYEQEKESIEREAASRNAVVQEQLRGAQAEADRQAAVARLEQKKSVLEQELALAQKYGRTEDADKLNSELKKVGEGIDTQGDFIKSAGENLKGSLGDIFGNLFSGDGDAVKDSFRKPFAALAGGLKQLATAKIIEVLLSAIPSTGIIGFFATLLLRPLVTAAVNKILDPVIGGLLSFPTGARFDAPTLALIGDGKRLGGDNREWLFRDDQLRMVLRDAVLGSAAAFSTELRGLRDDVRALQFRLVVSGRDLTSAVNRTQRYNAARIIGAASPA